MSEMRLSVAFYGDTLGMPRRPGLRVPNLEDSHARMVSMNVPCTRERESVCGVRVARHSDPDGVVLPAVGERSGRP